MKVKMGPYRYNYVTCRIFDKRMFKKYGVLYYTMPQAEYSKTDRFFEKLESAIQSIYNVTINQVLKLRSNERKIVVKLHKYDTWSMDETLAHIVVPMLKQLKESKQGAANVDAKDVPKELRPSKEEEAHLCSTGEIDENFFKRWDYVIDEMIFAFESYITDWEEKYHSGVFDWVSTPVDKEGNVVPKEQASYFRMDDGPNHTFKVDWKGIEKERKRIQKGLQLFAKYYGNLWD